MGSSQTTLQALLHARLHDGTISVSHESGCSVLTENMFSRRVLGGSSPIHCLGQHSAKSAPAPQQLANSQPTRNWQILL